MISFSFTILDVENCLIGCIAMACATAALFFLKFYKSTNDRLFLYFSGALFLMSLNRLWTVFMSDESRTIAYSIRVLSFLVIAVAIIDKNRTSQAQAGPVSPGSLSAQEDEVGVQAPPK